MSQCVRLACLQMNSSPDVVENLSTVEAILSSSHSMDLLLLPESFVQMPARAADQHIEADLVGDVQQRLSGLAKLHQVNILAGSMPIFDVAGTKPFARSVLLNAQGERVGQYDKLHLFDVDTDVGVNHAKSSLSSRYRESDRYQLGELSKSQLMPVPLLIEDSYVQIGLTICYDLRFPEMYRALASNGAQLICVPSAFTYQTGLAHWETLLKARAIENQVFIAAPAQVGEHANGRKTWGHTMIVDPWGQVIAEQQTGEGLVFAEIDLTTIRSLRERFPVHKHKRL